MNRRTLLVFCAAWCMFVSASSAQDNDTSFSGGQIEILSPVNGTGFHPGEQVTVRLKASDMVDRAVLVPGYTGTFVNVPGSELSSAHYLAIPANCSVGEYPIGVLAVSKDGKSSGPVSVVIKVTLPEDIHVVSLADCCASSVLFLDTGVPNNSMMLTIMAEFSDGVKRNVTPGSSGTRYVVTESTTLDGEPSGDIIRVSENGVITVLNPGHAVLKIMNGGASVTYPVEVSDR